MERSPCSLIRPFPLRSQTPPPRKPPDSPLHTSHAADAKGSPSQTPPTTTTPRAPRSPESITTGFRQSPQIPAPTAQTPAYAFARIRGPLPATRTSPLRSESRFPAPTAARSSRICSSCFLPTPSPRLCFDLFQSVTGARIQIQFVKFLQIPNLLQRCRTERRLPIERVQNNTLQHIAQSHIVIFRKRLEHLEDAFLHPHPSLHPLNLQLCVVNHGTSVPNYQHKYKEKRREGSAESKGCPILLVFCARGWGF